MKLGRATRLLLILTFFVGQLFAVAHASQHELVDHGSAGCEICAIAHAAPVPPAVATVAVLALRFEEPAGPAKPGLSDRRPFARPNTRGPPALLA